MYNHVSHDYEWTPKQVRDWVRYQHAVNTEQHQKTINYQRRELERQYYEITEYQSLLASEMKEQIQNLFADKISESLKKNIYSAIRRYDISDPDLIIRMTFPASSIRYKTPDELEKLVVDWYVAQLPQKLKFGVENIFEFTKNKTVTVYRIIIPELIYNYTKPNA